MLDSAARLLKLRNDIIPGPLHYNPADFCFSISPPNLDEKPANKAPNPCPIHCCFLNSQNGFCQLQT
jgi:hypothetical protein